ncbi:MAG: hypothetical protein G01um101466_499 [Parcubacteria group bacterium Gr01-1014_66]|nr:MAG: hypothetical protein G01um101466_499 [Parcubacteria group bacterium Gr01-1014_66]
MFISINYLAVCAAALSTIIVGALWYGPLFGKIWISLMGFTPKHMEELKKRGAGKSYALAFIGSLVMAYVLAHFTSIWETIGIGDAFQLAFWIWLGFIATTTLGSVLWEGKSWKLYLLNIAHQFLSLFVMTSILTLWR